LLNVKLLVHHVTNRLRKVKEGANYVQKVSNSESNCSGAD
jgi:hypothetical protein